MLLMNVPNVLFGVCNHEYSDHHLCKHRDLVIEILGNTNFYFRAGRWGIDSNKKSLVQGSRMRQTTRVPVNCLLFSPNLLHCNGGCWETECFQGNTADLWKCSRHRTTCEFLPDRYLILSVQGNALETIIQKPLPLASSMLHTAATVTDICVLNKSLFTLSTLCCCSMISKLRKSWLPGYIDEEV